MGSDELPIGRILCSDLRVDPADGTPGLVVPLSLTFLVSTVRSGGCTALARAMVDL